MLGNQDITTTENADGSTTVWIEGATQSRVKKAAAKAGATPENYLRQLIAADKPRRAAFVAAARN